MHRTTRDKDVTYKERRTTILAASDRRRNFEYATLLRTSKEADNIEIHPYLIGNRIWLLYRVATLANLE